MKTEKKENKIKKKQTARKRSDCFCKKPTGGNGQGEASGKPTSAVGKTV